MSLSWFQYLKSALGFRVAIPQSEKDQIDSEGVRFIENDIATRLKLRRPGKISGAVAKVTLIITRQRLLLYTGAIPRIDIAFTDPAFAQLEFTCDEADLLTIKVPRGIGADRWTKFDRTFSLSTTNAWTMYDLVTSHQTTDTGT